MGQLKGKFQKRAERIIYKIALLAAPFAVLALARPSDIRAVVEGGEIDEFTAYNRPGDWGSATHTTTRVDVPFKRGAEFGVNGKSFKVYDNKPDRSNPYKHAKIYVEGRAMTISHNSSSGLPDQLTVTAGDANPL